MNSVTRFFIIGALTAALAGNLLSTPFPILPLYPLLKPYLISIFPHDRPSSAEGEAGRFFWPFFSGEAPTAQDDSYLTDEDTSLVVSAPGVLANDSDLEADPLTATLVAGPASGDLALTSDGSFVYTPAPDYFGSDSFTYSADDGSGNSTPATVTLTIMAVNDAPVALDDLLSLAEDTPLVIPATDLLANDSDAENDPLVAVLEAGQEPVHGALVSNPDGSFLYTPDVDYTGVDAFQYRASDGLSNSDPATVSLTITPLNDLPTAQDDTHSTAEDTVLSVAAPGLLANDTDIEADVLSAILEAGPAYGTLTLDPDGSFTYTPARDYSGPDAFTYRAADGEGGSTPATVFLTVTPINDAPTGAGESYTTAEDIPLALSAPGILANDDDVEGDLLTPSLTVGPAHGQLSLNPDGSFVYSPAADYSGPDSFQYSVSDGELTAGDFTAFLTVTPLNDPPVAQADAYSLAEDSPLTRTAPGVLANDTDIESDPLSAAVASGPAHGTLDLAPDGSFSYTPFADYHGPDSFTYTAGDSLSTSPAATVELTITPVNDAPMAHSETYTSNEDIPLAVSAPGLLANDTDVDNDSLSAVLVSAPAHGSIELAQDGSFTYTPAENYHGADHFSYSARDADLASDAVTVDLTVTPVNDPPTAGDDTQTLYEDTPLAAPAPGVLANDSDVDGDPLTAVLVSGPTHGDLSLNVDGSYQYTPAANVYGLDSFSYRAADAGLSSPPATVTLTIAPVNDPPLALPDSFSTDEDTPLIIPAASLLANDSDIENDPLSAQLVEAPAHGSLTLEADGSFIYTPELNYNGADAFTYFATDGDAESPLAAVSISITAVNDAPLAGPEAYTTAEDTALARAAPGLLANDSDTENEPLSAMLVTGPAHGTLALGLDGSFTYSPSTDYYGPDSFSHSADDAALASEPVTVALTVTPVNDPPVALVDAYSLAEDAVLTLAAPGLLANDSDIENDPLSAAVIAPPQFGALVLSPDGSLIYTPTADYYGPDSFTYTAVDPLDSSAAVTVELSITPVNDAPIARAESYPTDEDTPLSISAPGLLANDTDIDSPTLTAMLDSSPAHGTIQLNEAGSFTYSPAADYHGPDAFTYHTYDGELDSGPVTVDLTVASVNDMPIAAVREVTTDEDTPLTVTLSASDVDGDPLSYQPGAPAHGDLTLVSPGMYTYTPRSDYFGADSFAFTANDGALESVPATISIDVLSVNDAPTGVLDHAYTTAEESTLAVSAFEGVLKNDSDVEGDLLSSILASRPAHGELDLHVDGSFEYTPAADFYGEDRFSYYASDGRLSSALTTVIILVTNVNDAPVAVDDAYTTGEDTPLSLSGPNGVQANDYDVDRIDTLTTVLDLQPAHGTLSLHEDGSFAYSPAPDYYGQDSFTYHLTDSQVSSAVHTVTLTITSINDMPITSADYYAVSMGGILTVDAAYGLLKNDRDIEADPLQTIIITQPVRGKIEYFSADGAFTYRTYPNLSGPVTFSYAVNDGQATSPPTTVTIDVSRPAAIQVIWESPARKEFSYQPGFYWVGNETIELRARPVNCPTDHCGIRYFRFDPTATGQQRFKDIADVTEPPYTYRLDTSILNDDWNEVMALAYDMASYDPENPDLEISDHFTYQAFDGVSYSPPATVTLTIIAVDETSQRTQSTPETRTTADISVEPQAGEAPLAANDYYETPAGVRLSVAEPGLLANDTDPEGEALTAALVAPPVHGAVTLQSDGSFDYITPVGASPRLSIFIRRFTRSGPLPRLYLPKVRR